MILFYLLFIQAIILKFTVSVLNPLLQNTVIGQTFKNDLRLKKNRFATTLITELFAPS